MPDELKNRRPEVDWQAVAAAGNVYRHEYDVVDDALIWHTAQHDLAGLRKASQAELDRIAVSRVTSSPEPPPEGPR